MRRFFYYITLLILGALASVETIAQPPGTCSITITPSSTTVPCGGGNVTLTANGQGASSTPINEDFNNGQVGPGWSVSPAGQFNNPCGPGLDGTTHMWMGNTTAAPRTMETAPLDVSCGGQICFDLDYATQGGAAPCEGPDISATEGVYLEWSTDGGATWNTIFYFEPNTATGAYTAWDNYCFTIPAAAETTNTIFHWYQGGSSGTCCDHWGIDNVTITAQNCDPMWYDWTHISGTTGPTGDPAQQTVWVDQDTTFEVCYTNGTNLTCCETITITVNGMGQPTITPVDEVCLGANDGSVTIVPTGGTGPFTFDITAGPGSPMSNTTGTFNNLAPGTYTVETTDNANGCMVTSTFTIGPGANCCTLAHTETFEDPQCNQANAPCDGSITITATGAQGAVQYSIDNGTTLQVSNVFSGLCGGVYDIYLIDAAGCTSTSQVTLTEPPALTIDQIVPVDESCPNACDGSLTVNATNAVQYSIDGGNTTQASNVFSGLCAGVYDIIAYDAGGCIATSTGSVGSPNGITFSTDGDTTVCQGGSADISATATGGTAPLTFMWDNGLPSQATHTVNPGASTVYNVYVVDGNGCQTPVQSVVVDYNPPLQVTALSDQAICPGQSASISAVGQGGDGGPYTYTWDDGNGGTMNGQFQTVTPAQTTTYTVTFDDGCETQPVTDQITITVNAEPQVQFSADNLEGCAPVVVNFSNDTDPNLTGTCLWNFGDGTFSQDCNPEHVYDTPGCYDVTLTVTSPDGCTSTETEMQMICVFGYPTADFSFGPQPTTITSPTIDFVNESSGAVDYFWDLGHNGATSTATNPTYTYPSDVPGTYPVCLTVTNSDGCVDDTCYNVVIDGEFLFYAPNAFTPDGDGINDVFLTYVTGEKPTTFELHIFDRWGQRIFYTESPDEPWDGSINGQVASKTDVYVWKVKVTSSVDNKKHEFYGHVSLLK